MSEHDLVIRGGTVIDGSGSDRRTADVAVSNGVVTEVGQVSGTGHREVAADGKLVQPGFVDIHTHYDGQATWDSQLAPSSWHGVTTIVMGNCGVGFAPVRPSDHERLIRLMEGVEDIPGTALHEGLPWAWESFEEYLDFLDGRSYDIDLGAQLPHAAVRVNVMGDRGVAREPATPDDIAQMAEIARRAVEAGAIGFTSSRSLNHRASTGEYTPTLQAERDEMIGIAEALGAAGKGVIQIISDLVDFDQEFALAKAMGARSGRPVSMSVAQAKGRPDQWRRTLDAMSQATAEGVVMRGQVGARAVGLLMGHQGTLNPFMHCEAYKAIAHLPLAERVEALRRDEVRSAILDNVIVDKESPIIGSRLVTKWHIMYPLGDPPDYEPDASTSLAAIAERTGADPAVLAYDLLLERDGTAMIYVPTVNLCRWEPRLGARTNSARRRRSWIVRRRRARRHHLRCQLPHHPDAMVGPRPTPRPYPSRNHCCETGQGDSGDRRLHGPRTADTGLQGRHQRDRFRRTHVACPNHRRRPARRRQPADAEGDRYRPHIREWHRGC